MTESNFDRVLLVGASGRIGLMLLHHWPRVNSQLKIVPQSREQKITGGLSWIPTNGPEPLMEYIRSNGRFHAMVILAGVTPGQGQPFELNTILAENCLEAASRADISRVLLASSSAVYGIGDGRPFTEKSTCYPINEYGQSKLRMEDACRHFRDKGIDLCYLRIGNVAGADALLMNIARAMQNEPIEIDIFENGLGPVRSYIGPSTLARVLQTLCLHPKKIPEVLNIATPTPISMTALAIATKHPWRPRPAVADSPQYITLNCDSLEEIFKFLPADSSPSEMIDQWSAGKQI